MSLDAVDRVNPHRRVAERAGHVLQHRRGDPVGGYVGVDVYAHDRVLSPLSGSAGSHEITELTHAPWTSYLVSARTVEVPPFTEAETRLLLTEPLTHSQLWQRDDPGRPRFDPAFWGDRGIERVHAEAAGWPHLVQLIAETAVDLINDVDAKQLDADLLGQASDKAIVRGDNVLRLLMQTESTLPGEWDYLLGFRRHDTQPPPNDEDLYMSLRRRLLVKEVDEDWTLRVPLMQRWLRARA